jgi:hypothetical protein
MTMTLCCHNRSIYDESSVGVATGAQQSAKDAIKKQHKLYALESPRRSDMGSVPNVSAVSKVTDSSNVAGARVRTNRIDKPLNCVAKLPRKVRCQVFLIPR